MADILSQSEVESLLATLEPGAGAPVLTVPPVAERRSRINVYDFKRPERVSKDQMRGFQALHESFSRELGAALSGMLRAIVEVKLVSVDQLTYNEFVFSLENPTCFNLLFSEGLEGHFILDLNPTIIFPIVDRLLGGGKTKGTSIPNRPLTEIELHLVSRITSQTIQALEHAWSNICELRLRVQQVESNPQLVQIVPPNEVIVLISFELGMGEIRGIMNLCIPYNTIEPLAGKLSSDSWSAYQKKGVDPRQKLNLDTGVKRATVELVVHLARGKLTVRDLAQLEVGDVILTETGCREGAQVLVEGCPLFRAYPGLLKGHKAIRMGSPITRPKDAIARQLQELGLLPETAGTAPSAAAG
jgi:flagellar motor switch protein FliM